MYESKDKMVSHPSHYQSSSGLECIDVIKAATEKLKGIEAVDTAQVIKYIWRWKEKNGKQDLEKAKWYLQDLIEHLEAIERAKIPKVEIECKYCSDNGEKILDTLDELKEKVSHNILHDKD